MEIAAKSLDIELHPYRLRQTSELLSAIGEMEKAHIEAIESGEDQIALGNIEMVISTATRARLLSIGPEDVPRSGGVMGYGVDFVATYRHAASFIQKILNGTSPTDLPIERASKFRFILNLKAAKALGFEVPATTLLRADEVIE
jgi:putative ABC transport system substrate-binding protein